MNGVHQGRAANSMIASLNVRMPGWIASMISASVKRFELSGDVQLGEDVGDFFTDHVDSKEFAVRLGVEDELLRSLRVRRAKGAAAGGEEKFADFDFAILPVHGPSFSRHAHAGDLRMGVGADED